MAEAAADPSHAPAGVALVTGATGFVGSHLVDALVEERWRVRCLVRPTSRLRWLPAEKIELATGSVADPGSLRDALRDVRVVFHLAGVTPGVSGGTYDGVNVAGTSALLGAMREASRGALLVHCSSQAAAGPARAGRPVTESDPPRPIGPYGASKLAAERLVAGSGLDHVIVRPPAVYGPRDVDFLPVFRLARRGLALRIAPADQRLSLIHVRDLALGFLDAAERGANRGIFFLTDGSAHTWRDVIDAVASAVGRRPRVVPVPILAATAAARGVSLLARLRSRRPLLTTERVRDLAQRDWTCDDARARRELGFRTSLPLREGMADTAAWYRDNRWL
ncbi:MAG: NAD-dependent epimerase/dehydratase family protein [Gemmatimonadota bacterium]